MAVPGRPLQPSGIGATGRSQSGPSAPLPPARLAVRFGASPGARRVQRWIVVVWLVLMSLGAGLAWLLWQLPAVLAVPLVVVVGLGAVAGTTGMVLVVATMRRASVAAGDGWVGYRVLGRWKVMRPVTPGSGFPGAGPFAGGGAFGGDGAYGGGGASGGGGAYGGGGGGDGDAAGDDTGTI